MVCNVCMLPHQLYSTLGRFHISIFVNLLLSDDHVLSLALCVVLVHPGLMQFLLYHDPSLQMVDQDLRTKADGVSLEALISHELRHPYIVSTLKVIVKNVSN